MSTQPEALRLADQLRERFGATVPTSQAAAELRRQHAEIERLRSVLTEARAALQFANDQPFGAISDTIWMIGRPETLFDFIDVALERKP